MLSHTEFPSAIDPKADHRRAPAPALGQDRQERYAICYTPKRGSAFAAFGRSWFGRANDGATLHAFSASSLGGLVEEYASPFPGRYIGLHAPFFSPFPLREEANLNEVDTRLMAFASHRKKIETGPLVLACVKNSLVLQPAKPRPELSWLALQCFNAFESFAANSPMAETEHPHLSRHQKLLLKSFGQPHVMSEFRFSIALTGALEPAHLSLVANALAPMIADLCAEGALIDGLSLVAETGRARHASPMRLIGRHPLAD